LRQQLILDGIDSGTALARVSARLTWYRMVAAIGNNVVVLMEPTAAQEVRYLLLVLRLLFIHFLCGEAR
jgi:hypothetical protein